VEGGEDAQVRVGEEPELRVASRGSGCADGRTEMLAARHGSKVLRADTRQLRDLIFGEDFLSGFDSDHFLAFFSEPVLSLVLLLRIGQVALDLVPSHRQTHAIVYFCQHFTCRSRVMPLSGIAEFASISNQKI
jgi:hypothetical protein